MVGDEEPSPSPQTSMSSIVAIVGEQKQDIEHVG